MDGVLLALGNRDLDRVVIRRRSDSNLLERGSQRAKHAIGLFERGMHLGRDRQIFLIEVA